MTAHPLDPSVRIRAGADRSTARRIDLASPSLTSVSESTVELTFSLGAAGEARHLAAEIALRADRAWKLIGSRALAPIGATAGATLPVGASAVVERNGRSYQIQLGGGMLPSLTFGLTDGRLRLQAIVRDWDAAGLSYWREPITAPAATSLSIRIHQLPSPRHALWVEPYPNGARAAICLTDHADHDTIDKLRPLVDLLGTHGVRYTKSVFPQSEPRPSQGKFEPGLDDPAFWALMSEARDRGAEIAYHSFGPRPRTPTIAEARQGAERMAAFGATTYIDHGKGDHNFAHDDLLAPGLTLTGFLADFGIENYWSHFDAYQNPFRLRSAWAPIRATAAAADVVRSIEAVGIADRRGATYLLLHGLNNVVGAEATTKVRQGELRGPRALAAEHRSLRIRQRTPPLLYRPSGDSVFDRSAPDDEQSRRWVFDTVLLNHLGAQLAPAAVDRLVEGSGLLLGHCYLGAAAPYMRRHTLEVHAGAWRPTPAFRTAVEHLAARQAAGAVATLSFAELRATLERFRDTELVRHRSGWEVRGCRGAPAAPVTHDRSVVFRTSQGTATTTTRDRATTLVATTPMLSLADPPAPS